MIWFDDSKFGIMPKPVLCNCNRARWQTLEAILYFADYKFHVYYITILVYTHMFQHKGWIPVWVRPTILVKVISNTHPRVTKLTMSLHAVEYWISGCGWAYAHSTSGYHGTFLLSFPMLHAAYWKPTSTLDMYRKRLMLKFSWLILRFESCNLQFEAHMRRDWVMLP